MSNRALTIATLGLLSGESVTIATDGLIQGGYVASAWREIVRFTLYIKQAVSFGVER